jgi:hypothetical protein
MTHYDFTGSTEKSQAQKAKDWVRDRKFNDSMKSLFMHSIKDQLSHTSLLFPWGVPHRTASEYVPDQYQYVSDCGDPYCDCECCGVTRVLVWESNDDRFADYQEIE